MSNLWHVTKSGNALCGAKLTGQPAADDSPVCRECVDSLLDYVNPSTYAFDWSRVVADKSERALAA